MKIETSELTGPALAYAVAQITPDLMQVGLCFYIRDAESGERVLFNPAENWSQGGPIIERECIQITPYNAASAQPKNAEYWCAAMYLETEMAEGYGPTPLIAAMRCFVSSRLGDEIELPEELK